MLEIFGGHAILPGGISKGISVAVKDSKMVDIGKTIELRKKYRFSDSIGSDKWTISPGFIDAHLHSSQHMAIGKVKSAKLLDWLKAIWKWEGEMTKTDAKKCAGQTYSELAAAGVTSFVDYTSVRHTEEAFKVAEKMGLRATIGKTMMDRNSIPELLEDTDQSLKETEQLIRRWHKKAGGRLRYSITPRFAITCTDELLFGAIGLSRKYKTMITTHAHENTKEVAYDKRIYGKSAILHYNDIGLLGKNTLLVHGVWLSKKELSVLAKTKTSMVHCPGSNFMLKSGCSPIGKIMKAGIKLGLGSDIGAYKNVSPFDQMKLAIRMQKQNGKTLNPKLAFYLVTQGSADAIGLGKETGSLEIGKKADVLLLDIDAKSSIASIVNASTKSVKKTIANGKLVFDGEYE
jgi:5-methylthioadenosine/S-adenosylhomocysteine deaminase